MTSNDELEDFLNAFKDTRKDKKRTTQTKFTTNLNVIIPKDKIGNKKKIKPENFKKF